MSRLEDLKQQFIVDVPINRLALIKPNAANLKRSPCCGTAIYAALSDGVFVGSCALCGNDIFRRNPRNGNLEWLHGESPWTPLNAES